MAIRLDCGIGIVMNNDDEMGSGYDDADGTAVSLLTRLFLATVF